MNTLLTPNPYFASCTRREQTIWSRIKIGHTNITHVHLMKKEPRPSCEFCNISLISIKHLFLECPSLTKERKIFPRPANTDNIISIKNVKLLMYFLKKKQFVQSNLNTL